MKVAEINKHMSMFPPDGELDRYLELIEELLRQGYTAITFSDVKPD